MNGARIWVYDDEGLYRLEPEADSARLIYALPRSFLGLGSIINLADGGALLAHADRFDRRLIRLDAGGVVLWQRSYTGVVPGQVRLLAQDGRVYLLSQDHLLPTNELSVLAVDIDTAELTRLFTGGTRSAQPEDTWAFAVADDRLIINIGGGSMAGLDSHQALATHRDQLDNGLSFSDQLMYDSGT